MISYDSMFSSQMNKAGQASTFKFEKSFQDYLNIVLKALLAVETFK